MPICFYRHSDGPVQRRRKSKSQMLNKLQIKGQAPNDNSRFILILRTFMKDINSK